MSLRSRDFLSLARIAAECCSEKKAEDVRFFDVRRRSAVADYYVLASVGSGPQMQAVLDLIDRRIKETFQMNPLHREGRSNAQWAILDYGGAVVHVMHRTAREFYGLERLWVDAKEIKWQEREAAQKAKETKKPRARKPVRRNQRGKRRK